MEVARFRYVTILQILSVLFNINRICAQSREEPFKVLRHEEDYSYLKNDTTGLKNLNRIKYLSLNKKLYVSIGGELRYQYERYENENWGDVSAVDKYGYLLQRTMLHMDLKFKKYLSLFAQVKSGIVFEKKTPMGPLDRNDLDFHQAYIEGIPWQDSTGNKVLLRLGRFELLYGTGRLISVADMPNNRINFQGGLVKVKKKSSEIEAFIVRPIQNKEFIFDDAIDSNAWLWGAYSKHNLKSNKGVDIYYLGADRKDAMFESGINDQTRHTIGLKYYSTYRLYFNYDIELAYQFGVFGSRPVSAYYFSAELSYALKKTKYKPTFSLGNNIISGNRNKSKYMGTFDALYPRPYFGQAAPIGPSNLIDIHPGFRIYPRKRFYVSFEIDCMWRYSSDDALYTPSVDVSRPVLTSNSKYIGTQYIVEANYQINKYFSFFLNYNVFPAAKFIQETGADKILSFFLTRISFKF